MIFKYESELVDKFINYIANDQKSIIINEMNTRYGNIDIVKIDTYQLSFNNAQIETLAKPSNSKIFMYLKNNRFLNINTIIKNIGLSKNTIKTSLNELIKKELVVAKNDLYRRKEEFYLPKTNIFGFEAKLYNFQKAFYQAIENIKYVDYSYIVFPMEIAKKISVKYEKELKDFKIGLIGVSDSEYLILIKASKVYKMSDSIRLLNLAKSYNFVKFER